MIEEKEFKIHDYLFTVKPTIYDGWSIRDLAQEQGNAKQVEEST